MDLSYALANATEDQTPVSSSKGKRKSQTWSEAEVTCFVDFLFERRHECGGGNLKPQVLTKLGKHLAVRFSPERSKGSIVEKISAISHFRCFQTFYCTHKPLAEGGC